MKRKWIGALTQLFLAALIVSSGAKGAGSRLPVIGCKTEVAAGSGIPVIPGYLPRTAPAPNGLNVDLRSKLVWYEGDVRQEGGFKLLGPRGWSCFALVGADGGWSMNVVPHRARPDQKVEVFGYYNGPGASEACDYFPSAYPASPVPSMCRPPSGATITLENRHLVTFTTTPAGTFYVTNRNGEFVTVRSRLSDHGFLYWYPSFGNTAEGVHCVLPRSDRLLCERILAEARSRLGNVLGGHH
jgi:hypothetical protein